MPFALRELSSDEATSSCSAKEEHSRVPCSGVGHLTAGKSESGALVGAEAAAPATESIVCFGKEEIARGANSVEPCKDDGHAGCKDEIEMVEMQNSMQLARTCVLDEDNSDGSLDFYDPGDQDYRKLAHCFSKGKTSSVSHASDGSNHHANLGQHDDSSLSRKHCDQTSAAVDMSCVDDAEVSGTESKELKHTLTSKNRAVRLLNFDGEGSTKENAPERECSLIAFKLSNRPTEAPVFPFMLQGADGSALAKVMLVRTLMGGKNETTVSSASSAVGGNLQQDDQVGQNTDSALARRRRECKLKYLKRQLRSSPEEVATAAALPGYVGDRDISYLVNFVEGSSNELTVEASKVSSGNCSEIKSLKKKEKRKKAAACSAGLTSLEESTMASVSSSLLSPAAPVEPTQADNVAADQIVMNDAPETGFDTAFLIVDRKRKTVKPAVACPWVTRPAVPGLSSSAVLGSVTFGVEHPSLTLPPTDEARDSSSSADDLQLQADDDAYPPLDRLPRPSGAAVSGFSCDIGTTSLPETASSVSQVLGKDKLPKESWAAVAARGLLRRNLGARSGNPSIGSQGPDSTTGGAQCAAASGRPCGEDIASTPSVSHRAAAAEVDDSTSSLAEVLSGKGLQFVGKQRKLFLSMPSSKIPLSFIGSDSEDMLLSTTDEATSYEPGPAPASGSEPSGAHTGGLETLHIPPLEEHTASGEVPASAVSGGLETLQIPPLEEHTTSGVVPATALSGGLEILQIPPLEEHTASGVVPAAALSGGLEILQIPALEEHTTSGVMPAAALSGGLETLQILLLKEQNGNTVDGPSLKDNFDMAHMEAVRHLTKEWLQVQEFLIRGHERVVYYEPGETVVKSGPQAEV